MSEPSLPEPLDDFLQHPPQLPVDAERKGSLYQRTNGLLRKPARRRWPIAAAVAASIVFAVIAAYSYFSRTDEIPPTPPKQKVVERKPDPPAPKSEPPKPDPPLVQASTNPRDIEWQAFDAENDQVRVRLYFLAGNVYLDKHQDIDGALRCYRQAFHYGEARDMEFNPEDNWLVMALKRDQRKEN